MFERCQILCEEAFHRGDLDALHAALDELRAGMIDNLLLGASSLPPAPPLPSPAQPPASKVSVRQASSQTESSPWTFCPFPHDESMHATQGVLSLMTAQSDDASPPCKFSKQNWNWWLEPCLCHAWVWKEWVNSGRAPFFPGPSKKPLIDTLNHHVPFDQKLLMHGQNSTDFEHVPPPRPDPPRQPLQDTNKRSPETPTNEGESFPIPEPTRAESQVSKTQKNFPAATQRDSAHPIPTQQEASELTSKQPQNKQKPAPNNLHSTELNKEQNKSRTNGCSTKSKTTPLSIHPESPTKDESRKKPRKTSSSELDLPRDPRRDPKRHSSLAESPTKQLPSQEVLQEQPSSSRSPSDERATRLHSSKLHPPGLPAEPTRRQSSGTRRERSERTSDASGSLPESQQRLPSSDTSRTSRESSKRHSPKSTETSHRSSSRSSPERTKRHSSSRTSRESSKLCAPEIVSLSTKIGQASKPNSSGTSRESSRRHSPEFLPDRSNNRSAKVPSPDLKRRYFSDDTSRESSKCYPSQSLPETSQRSSSSTASSSSPERTRERKRRHVSGTTLRESKRHSSKVLPETTKEQSQSEGKLSAASAQQHSSGIILEPKLPETGMQTSSESQVPTLQIKVERGTTRCPSSGSDRLPESTWWRSREVRAESKKQPAQRNSKEITKLPESTHRSVSNSMERKPEPTRQPSSEDLSRSRSGILTEPTSAALLSDGVLSESTNLVPSGSRKSPDLKPRNSPVHTDESTDRSLPAPRLSPGLKQSQGAKHESQKQHPPRLLQRPTLKHGVMLESTERRQLGLLPHPRPEFTQAVRRDTRWGPLTNPQSTEQAEHTRQEVPVPPQTATVSTATPRRAMAMELNPKAARQAPRQQGSIRHQPPPCLSDHRASNLIHVTPAPQTVPTPESPKPAENKPFVQAEELRREVVQRRARMQIELMKQVILKQQHKVDTKRPFDYEEAPASSKRLDTGRLSD